MKKRGTYQAYLVVNGHKVPVAHVKADNPDEAAQELDNTLEGYPSSQSIWQKGGKLIRRVRR